MTDPRHKKCYWDAWQSLALARGVAPDLAALGRAVMRDYTQQSKPAWHLGAEADAERMLAMCLGDPSGAREAFDKELLTAATR